MRRLYSYLTLVALGLTTFTVTRAALSQKLVQATAPGDRPGAFRASFDVVGSKENRVRGTNGLLELDLKSDIWHGPLYRRPGVSIFYEVVVNAATYDEKEQPIAMIPLVTRRSPVIQVPKGTSIRERTPFRMVLQPGRYEVEIAMRGPETDTYTDENGVFHREQRLYNYRRITAIVE